MYLLLCQDDILYDNLFRDKQSQDLQRQGILTFLKERKTFGLSMVHKGHYHDLGKSSTYQLHSPKDGYDPGKRYLFHLILAPNSHLTQGNFLDIWGLSIAKLNGYSENNSL